MPKRTLKTFTVDEVIHQACIDKYGKDYEKKDKNKKWNDMCDEIDLCQYEVTSREFSKDEVREEIEEGEDTIQNRALINLMTRYKVKNIRVDRD